MRFVKLVCIALNQYGATLHFGIRLLFFYTIFIIFAVIFNQIFS